MGSYDDGKVWAFDADTGEVLWTWTMGGLINSSAAVVNGWVYVGSFDHKLYVFHLG